MIPTQSKVLFRKPRVPTLEKLSLKNIESEDTSLVDVSNNFSLSESDSSEPSTQRRAAHNQSPNGKRLDEIREVHEIDANESFAQIQDYEVFKLPKIANNDEIESKAEEEYENQTKRFTSPAFNAKQHKNTPVLDPVELKDNRYLSENSNPRVPLIPKTKNNTRIEPNSANNIYQNMKIKTPIKGGKDAIDQQLRVTYSSQLNLVKPYKPRGPDPLPRRALRFHQQDLQMRKNLYENLSYENENLECLQSESRRYSFDLNDFLLDNYVGTFCLNSSGQQFVSNYNYNQICRILEAKIQMDRNQESNYVHINTLMPDLKPVETRKPIRQAMIEMANFLKNELSFKTGTKLKTKFKPVSKWQRLQGAQTELIIYEDENANKLQSQDEIEESNEADENEITVSQLAVLDSLLKNGLALSLKGHFIKQLPELNSLKSTLIYVNLSYNNFNEFPNELLDMLQLEAIKIRNNPLRHLPDKMCHLQALKILDLSFCLFSKIPECVFDLENLVQLSLGFNKLSKLDERIVKLTKLKRLNLEGNELEYLPCSMLNMRNLRYINVKSNYLHPLIWRKIQSQNPVQSLFEMSAAVLWRELSVENELLQMKLSNEVREKLDINWTRCDCCEGRIYGSGLKLIRPCLKIFGVKFLPFLFNSCSPVCRNEFKHK